MSTWGPLIGIICGVAAVLAVVGTALFIGVCLVVARLTDAMRARGGSPQRAVPVASRRRDW
ncbi:MAG TPA: hypothetical protein VF060_32150 [Trebonia sp.]